MTEPVVHLVQVGKRLFDPAKLYVVDIEPTHGAVPVSDDAIIYFCNGGQILLDRPGETDDLKAWLQSEGVQVWTREGQ